MCSRLPTEVMSWTFPSRIAPLLPVGAPGKKWAWPLLYESHNTTSETLALGLGTYFVVEGFLSILKCTT